MKTICHFKTDNMKRLTIILAVITLAACSKEQPAEVVYQDENITLERKVRKMKERFRVRYCCDYFNDYYQDTITCSTNNGSCKWCFDLCSGNVHPKGK